MSPAFAVQLGHLRNARWRLARYRRGNPPPADGHYRPGRARQPSQAGRILGAADYPIEDRIHVRGLNTLIGDAPGGPSPRDTPERLIEP